MKEPKVSLVFPCWHAAQHMPHVLEDLQAQTFKEFEAILVNDGDDSQMEAMEAIAAQDSRIRIIRLEQNSGVAAARNAGTDAVTTNWVTYPDPDDRFGPNYVKSLYKAVDGTGVEMACGGFTQLIVENGGIYNQFIKTVNDPMTTDIAAGYELMLSSEVFYSAWNKLYNIGIMLNNRLRQDSHFQIAQDYAFNMNYFTFCKKVGLVSNCDYIYYYNQRGSNGSQFHPFFFQYRLEIIDLREHFHRHIGWAESRIAEMRQSETVEQSLQYVKRFYAYGSPLPLQVVVKEIEKNYFSQPGLVDTVLKTDPGDDFVKRIFRILTKLGSPYIMAVTFRIMLAVRSQFPLLYARKRNLLRGDC